MSSTPASHPSVVEPRALGMKGGAWSAGRAMRDARLSLAVPCQKKRTAASGIRCSAADLKEVIERVLVM